MKIAICDDDKQELLIINEFVNKYLSSYFKESNFQIFCFESSMDLILEIENGKQYDIFILDVVMPDINGIQLATEIRSRDQVAKIIFLTSSIEFAVDSYSVDAFNYLLKPVQEERLNETLEKILSHITHGIKDYIIVNAPTCLLKVFLYNLIYVEAIRRKIYFHLTNESIVESNSTLSEIELILLKDERFIKPHRSYIVNLDYIKGISSDVLATTNDINIPISRNLLKNVKQNYIDYSFKHNF